METFMVTLLRVLPEEHFISELKEALENYELDKSPEKRSKLATCLAMTAVKFAPQKNTTGDEIADAVAFGESFAKTKKWDALNPEKTKETVDRKQS